tara:strand:+ start:6939 stop:7535 length:597 start_codon:yes stop_codon:yes gene_type:complete
MAYISLFKVDPDGKNMSLTVQPASGSNLTELLMWTQDTYKNYNNAIDLTNLLNLTVTGSQTISISTSDISEDYLSGIYFIELTDNSTPSSDCSTCSNTELGVATDFSRFSYCLAEYLVDINYNCANCDNNLSTALTMKMYIDGLRDSLQLGNFTTAISFFENMDRFCSGSCVECSSTLSDAARYGLGFQTLGNELILY